MKIAVAITGASGAIYAKVLLEKLQNAQGIEKVALVLSSNARTVWLQELSQEFENKYNFDLYENNDFFAPIASGSAKYKAMIICPCSMGTMARIASGVSNDLITRAADVMLKERRKLVLVTRDTPLSAIHLNNMQTCTQAGAVIMPASPSFYSLPQTFEQLAATVIDRALDILEININTYRWGE
jgi:flavin prenyltransferase